MADGRDLDGGHEYVARETRFSTPRATAACLSARSLSRLFRSETALGFAQWRQRARLSHGLERLADGEPASAVADALGYASVSAFAAMFRRSFGQPPARYFAAQGAGWRL